MKNPGFQLTLIPFVGAIVFALSGMLHAEPPTNTPVVPQSKVSPVARAKPQIIYHVRPASNYAATLHSQQKTQGNDLPIDSDMPSSLQLSRSNANADARAQHEAAVVERNQTGPKIQKSRGKRPPFSVNAKGHGGKGHGGNGKGHKH